MSSVVSVTAAADSQASPRQDLAKVLVVDDTPANLLAFRAVLEQLPHEIVVARSGGEALELAKRHDFATILLDVAMPVMDGFETLRRLRHQAGGHPGPVILITANDLSVPDIERAYALGAIDYVVKPVHPEILRAKVNAHASLYVAHAELRRRQAALALKDRQIAVLAHDLRNPLSTITAAASLIRRDAAAESREPRLAVRIELAAKRMDGMIRDLLDYARAGSGAIPIVRERMDLGELCQELVEEFQIADPDRQITLSQHGDLVGEWDRARLYQALSNLVGNATRYGRGEATVTATGKDDGVEVVVSNSGEPIAPDLLPVIFEPFRRGISEGTGLGLGLYIVRAIAHGHGGEVSVTSSRQDGTSFVLRIPRRP